MVKLHTAKQWQIAFLSLLLISLLSFCADDAVEQQIVEAPRNITFSCNIPGLNVPLQFERTEDDIDKIALTFAAIDHGRLLCKQLKSQQGVQEMVIDHALLAAFRITIGLTSTVCHEFGHAICKHCDSYTTLKAITFRWSPMNILLGTFDEGHTEADIVVINAAKDESNLSPEMTHNNRIALMNRYKDAHRNKMICCAAGPLMGALSAYMLYKRAEYGYPSLPYGFIAFRDIGQNLGNLVPFGHATNYIGSRLVAAMRDGQTKRELEQSLQSDVSGPATDGDHFYDAWKKRKKAQARICKINELYQKEKEQKPIIDSLNVSDKQ